MKRMLLGVVLPSLLMLGCGGDLPPEDSQSTGAPAAPAPAPPGDGTAGKAQVIDTTVEASAEMSDDAMPDDAMPAELGEVSDDRDGRTEVAGVGVGVKGQNYGGPGLVTTPVEAFFRTEERIAFDIQIPSAMKLYKASNDNKGPKTHEEFMRVIVQENAVKLPELPPGSEYLYDPKAEQLLVRHPAEEAPE